MGDDYIGRDGWHIGRPVREIGDEYVRGKFLDEARKMLNTLQIYRRPQKIREKILKEDGNFSSHATIVNPTDEGLTNPYWYSEFYWASENTFRRKGRMRIRYDGRGRMLGGPEGYPTNPNKASKLAESTNSKVVRGRVVKSLEEIVKSTDIPLKITSRKARRVKIVDGKRERVWEETPYYHGGNVTEMRQLIADRLVEGYVPEQSEGRPFSEMPGDNQVRAYFGLGPLENPWAEIPREEESTEIKTQEEPETRQPGEDDIELENKKPGVPNEDFHDDIPF